MTVYNTGRIRSEVSDPYISSVSATILSLIKLLEGAAAGFILYRFISLVIASDMKINVIGSKISEIWETFFKAFYGLFPQLEGMTGKFADLTTASEMALLITAALIGGCLVLVIAEAAAVVTLRLFRRGTEVIRVIHLLHTIAAGAAIISLLLAYFSIFRAAWSAGRSAVPLLSTASRYVVNNSVISFVIPCILQFLPLYAIFCYHKDIADAMKTVRYEISTGVRDGSFRKTGFSVMTAFLGGFSLTYGIMLYLSCGILTFIPVAGLPVKYMIICTFLFSLKQFAISRCYSNLAVG